MNPLTYAKIVAVVAVFFAGWLINGWRWESKWTERELMLTEARAALVDQYREREQTLQAHVAQIDAEHTNKLREATDENDRLRAAVDAGSKRLLVRARCPATPGVPQATPGASVDNGARAELDPSARSTHYALRAGLKRAEEKLAACQETLAKERQ